MPVILNDNLSVQLSAGTGLTISGGISDTGSHALTINPGGSSAGTNRHADAKHRQHLCRRHDGCGRHADRRQRLDRLGDWHRAGDDSAAPTLTVPSGASAAIAPTGSNAVTIAGGGMLTLGPSIGPTAATLTLGNSLALQNGSVLNFTVGSLSSTPIVNLTGGSVTVSGSTATLNILDSPTTVGNYPLLAQTSGTISYSGFMLNATVPSQYMYSLQSLGSDLDLVVSQGVAWTGAITMARRTPRTGTSTRPPIGPTACIHPPQPHNTSMVPLSRSAIRTRSAVQISPTRHRCDPGPRPTGVDHVHQRRRGQRRRRLHNPERCRSDIRHRRQHRHHARRAMARSAATTAPRLAT